MSKQRITLSFESEEAFWAFVRNPGSLKLHQVELVHDTVHPAEAPAKPKRKWTSTKWAMPIGHIEQGIIIVLIRRTGRSINGTGSVGVNEINGSSICGYASQ